jgi:hypothetical protein
MTVTPACVQLGQTITVRVTTKPGAVVAYVAIYSDGKSGADPPWGAGYGGNAGGKASRKGVYTSRFTVKPNAPAGPARIEATSGWPGGSGDATGTFTVAGPTGTCE